jgi:tRNA pseudouridine55 synthase
LPKRRVWVYAVDVLDVALPEITLDIQCSSGTYIRSLAADFAGSLGSCGHLKALTRTDIGPFKVGRALSSSALFRGRDHALIEGAAIPLRAALPDMVEISVSNGLGKKIVHGYQPSIEEVSMGEDTWNDVRGPVKVVLHDRLIAIGHIQDASGPYMARFRIERVFQGLSN